jgi:hypothetical protein
MRIIAFFLLILLVIIIKYLKRENFKIENNDMFVVYPKGGLCNKLRVLLSYNDYALKIKKKLLVLWNKSDMCNGYFLDYFYPIKNINFIYVNNDTVKNYKIDYEGCMWHDDHKLSKKMYKKLRILPYIEEKMKKIIYNNKFNAIHVRRTDHTEVAKKHNSYTSDEEFIDFIKKSEDKVYVATDNNKTQNKFINMFPDKIISSKQLNNSDNLRKTTLEDAIIDLFICSRSKLFMGSGFSSFSGAINFLRP